MRCDYGITVCIDRYAYMSGGHIPIFAFTFKLGEIFKYETTAKVHNILRFRQIQIPPDTLDA